MSYRISSFIICFLVLSFMPNTALAQEEQSLHVELEPDQTELQSLIYSVWKSNPQIEEAHSRVEEARAMQKAASKWLRNPEIEFEQEEVEGEERSKIFGLSQEIDLSGKFLASGRVAQFELQAVKASNDLVQQEVTLGILEALIENQPDHAALGLFERRVELMTRFSNLASKKREVGDIGSSEQSLARLALSETMIGRAKAMAGYSQSQRDLKSAIGFDTRFVENLPQLPQDFPLIRLDEGNLDEMVMQLPSIRVLRNELDASRAEIRKARLKKLPDPTLSVRSGKEAGRDVVGLSVSMPLNVFNPFRAEVAGAKHAAEAQDRAFYGALYAAKPAILSSKRRYEVTLEAWLEWQKTGAQALSGQTHSLDQRYIVGDLNAGDYLVQVEQALDIELAALELRQEAWFAWFDWLRMSGGTIDWIAELGENK